MGRHPALKVLTVLVAIVLLAGGIARAAALVGETTHMRAESVPVSALSQLKANYRQPDTIPFPPSDPYTPEKALLGRMLFDDTRVSGAGGLACASCHNPAFAYGDGLAKGIGAGLKPLDRRSPSIVNGAWGVLFMWDGRASSLEEQASGPIEGPREMNQPLDRLVPVLAKIPEYQSLFAAAFPRRKMTPETIVSAIATYERTIVSGVAPFDEWIEGDEAAIPDAARRGFTLFNTKAGCASCHGGWLFTDDGFHDTGLPDDDLGRGQLFPRVVMMRHAFKTPGLREVASRGPYMHDGSLPTLEAVIAHYNQGGRDRPSKSELMTPLGLSADEQADIVAFLRTLTSSIRPSVIPTLPR
jgi:cytochrome c peroxidase